MEEIRLENNTWLYDPDLQLGPAGGFGAVYKGKSLDEKEVAVKRLNIDVSSSAQREMRVAFSLTNSSYTHIIPIYDAGEDAISGSYFVVMAIAEKSLQQYLNEKGPLSQSETVSILKQICKGLTELQGVVHRDLKPGNILLQDGVWKIADFGIARFIEEATSYNTLKECLSPSYAAPEQWLSERAQVATDLYSVGCIAQSLLTGAPPFYGQDLQEIREAHLHGTPEPLPTTVHPLLKSLIAMLLRKAPAARPSLNRTQELLGRIPDTAEARAASPLAHAAARIEQARSIAEAAVLAEEARLKERENLADTGKQILSGMFENFRNHLLIEAPNSEASKHSVKIGQAEVFLEGDLSRLATVPQNSFPKSGFDVVLALNFTISQVSPNYDWSTSLLFCQPPKADSYRWYEIGFMEPFGTQRTVPFTLILSSYGQIIFTHADVA